MRGHCSIGSCPMVDDGAFCTKEHCYNWVMPEETFVCTVCEWDKPLDEQSADDATICRECMIRIESANE